MHELFRLLCFEYKCMDIEYFMDKLTPWECDVVVENIAYMDRNFKDIMRYSIWYNALPNVKRGSDFQATDIFQYPWDEKDNTRRQDITDEEIEDMNKYAAEYEKFAKENKDKKPE